VTTAIGTYATLALVKARLGSDATYSAADDALITTLCGQINAWIETTTGRVIAPRADTEIVLDGLMAEEDGRVMPVPFGLNGLTSLEVAPQTGGAFVTVPATDCFLRPLPILRRQGWPATVIRMTDIPSPTNQAGRFYPGYGNVRLRGSAGFAGWPAIPDEIAELAITAVVRAWHARQAGQTDVIGSDEFGKPIVSRYVSGRDRDTLARYDLHPRTAGGNRMVTGY
jgi:hypothetical protein